MTSSMLSGDRRPASTRKSGMTVLGKVPKPINLPSQRLENQGNDPNVEIVPKGTFTWGSRSSSAVPNAWGTSSICSPNGDGSLSSPSGTRPSTAGSDRSHEQPSNAWSPNPRPSSASGALASGQLSTLPSRPRSAETRSGSSQLSRFADSSADNPVALVSPGISERLGVGSSKGSGFSLSTGDFPTLHPNKSSDTSSQRGHSFQGQPLSSQNRPTSASGPESRQNDFFHATNTTGDKNIDVPNHATTNSWKADNPHHTHQASPPNIDHWHRDADQPRPYPNMNIPPHYNSWHNPQFHQGPADGSWYNRAGPPANYPIDYPPGPPRPIFYEPYPRPYLQPEEYRRPAHPDRRPGAYPMPMPHEGYYGPPRPNFYGPADREASIMGMAPPPAVHNQYPLHNPANFHGRPSVMNNEQGKPDHLNGSQGQYRVLLKQNEGPEDQKRDWGSRSQVQEPMDFDSQSRDNAVKSSGIESSKVADGLLKNPEAPVIKKNPTLLEKVEGLNNKARFSDGQVSSSIYKANAESVAIEGEKRESNNYREVGENANFVYQKKAGVTRSADYKQKFNRHEINNEWTKKVPESESLVNTTVISSKSGSLESDSVDQIDDLNAQHAKMREVAIQRAKQLQQEEEERTRHQKEKALSKPEALNRRTLTESSTLKSSQPSSQTTAIQNITKKESPNDLPSGEAEKTETVKPVNKENVKKPSSVEAKAKPSVAPVITSITIGTIEIQPNEMVEEKQLSYRKKQSITVDAMPVRDQKNNNESSKNSKKDDQREYLKSASNPAAALNKTSKVNNHLKYQVQRKPGRNQHANVNNKQAMWAPVKPQSKNEVSSQGSENKAVNESAKQSENNTVNGSKAKRAEMERYVPKPAAKELSQQVDHNSLQISQDVETGDGSKHSISLPSKSSNSTAAYKSNATNKQRRQPYKANKTHATKDTNEQNFNAGVEHVKSHWQPKVQVKQNDTLQSTNDTLQSTANVQGDLSQNQESKRERKYDDIDQSFRANEEPFEGRYNFGSRYRGRGRNFQRGGGNFYARSVGVSTRAGDDDWK